MELENEWHEFLVSTLERKFPDSILVRLMDFYPGKNIIEAAISYIVTSIEVRKFFVEYQYYCRLCQIDNPHSDESHATIMIVGYFVIRKGGLHPLWALELDKEIKKIES